MCLKNVYILTDFNLRDIIFAYADEAAFCCDSICLDYFVI